MFEYLVMALFVAQPGEAKPGSSALKADAGTPAVAPSKFESPVEITADRFEIFSRKQQAVWTGHVRAKRGTVDLSCDRLLATYTQAQEISRIECAGGVEVVDGTRWAKGDRADFDSVNGILVVTGSPEAKDGPNYVRGTKVIFNQKKNTMQVENAFSIFETSPQGVPGVNRKKGKSPP
jgi:lipopolysaccharide export system protein LptA